MIELIKIGFTVITAPLWLPLLVIGKVFQELKYFYYENVTND